MPWLSTCHGSVHAMAQYMPSMAHTQAREITWQLLEAAMVALGASVVNEAETTYNAG